MASSTVSQWWKRLRDAETKVSKKAETPPVVTAEPEPPAFSVEDTVPRGLRIAGAWSWRTLALVAVIVLVCIVIIELRVIIIPVLIAIVLTALLTPVMTLLARWHVPRGFAVAITMLGFLAVVGALLWLVINQIYGEASELQHRSIDAYHSFLAWLRDSPLQIGDADISKYTDNIWGMIQSDGSAIWSGALSVGTTVGHLGAGLLLTVFSLLFILLDGKGIWRWVVSLMPRNARAAIDGAGKAGWTTLTNYSRTQVLVATIDAIGIGLGAVFLGLPLALPIAVLVFLGSFVPIVGAVLTGAVAVLIALVYNGLWPAIIMLIIVLAVQQIEGHVLQPLLMGSAVHVHPLAVVLSVTAGSMVAGIPGAFFAVPLVAVINVMTRYISSGRWRSTRQPEPALAGPGDVPKAESPRPASPTEAGVSVTPGDDSK